MLQFLFNPGHRILLCPDGFTCVNYQFCSNSTYRKDDPITGLQVSSSFAMDYSLFNEIKIFNFPNREK